MAVLLLRGLYITHSVIVQRPRSVRALAENDYVGASATKLAASGHVVPPPLARRDKAIQHGSVAGGPADERSVMLCGSDSSGVRRGVFRPCQSGNCRSEENTSELQSLMRLSYTVFLLIRGLPGTDRTANFFPEITRCGSPRTGVGLSENDYVCGSATKVDGSGNVVPPPLARRDKAIQHGSVAGGPADERSVMLCESESSGVRRGVSRPCKSGNCVVYWSQSSKKRPSIDCRPSPISAAHRHTPPFHEVRCRSPQIPTFVSPLDTSSPHRDPRRSCRQRRGRQFYSQVSCINRY